MPIIASVAAPIVGGLAGNLLAGGSEDEAKQAMQRAREDISGVRAPTVEEQQIALQKLASQGQLTPEMEQAIIQGQSQMAGISTDPRLRSAQMAALSSMQETGATGLNATDRAALQDIRNQNLQQTHSNQQAVLQNMQERGISGAGAELAAKLQAGQAGAQESQAQGLNVAGQAQARALQAIAGAGQLGGQLRGQEFGEKSDIAKAADEIARFNTANQQNVQQRNVGSRNTAQAANLAEKQRIADQNAALANAQEMHNKGLYQQQFQNQIQRGGMLSGQDLAQYGANKANAAQTRKMYSDIGSGVGKGFGAAAQAQNAPKFDANSGQALYNTQTGQQYQANKAHGGVIEGYADGGEIGSHEPAGEEWDKNLSKLVASLLHSKPKSYAMGGNIEDPLEEQKKKTFQDLINQGAFGKGYNAGPKPSPRPEQKAFGGMADAGGGMNYAGGGEIDPIMLEKWKKFQQGFNSTLDPTPVPSPSPKPMAFGGMNDEGGMWAGGTIPSMPKYAEGGEVADQGNPKKPEELPGQEYLTQIANMANTVNAKSARGYSGGGAVSSGPSIYLGEYADGGQVHDFRVGGKVPGIAPFPGDDLKNDIVDAKVSPGEIVVPRTIANKDNETIATFVRAVKSRSNRSRG